MLLMESGILSFGIRNTDQGIWNPNNDRIPVLQKKTGIQYLESGIHSVESSIQDYAGLFPYMG